MPTNFSAAFLLHVMPEGFMRVRHFGGRLGGGIPLIFGSNKKILLKTKQDLTVISHTLIANLWPIRVHEFIAREISMLQERKHIVLGGQPVFKRFAYHVGRRCRTATIKDVAKELKLDWHTVKELDQAIHEGTTLSCR